MNELKFNTSSTVAQSSSPIKAELECMKGHLNDLEDYTDKLKVLLEPILLDTPGAQEGSSVGNSNIGRCPLAISLNCANDQMVRIRLKLGAIMDSIQL